MFLFSSLKLYIFCIFSCFLNFYIFCFLARIFSSLFFTSYYYLPLILSHNISVSSLFYLSFNFRHIFLTFIHHFCEPHSFFLPSSWFYSLPPPHLYMFLFFSFWSFIFSIFSYFCSHPRLIYCFVLSPFINTHLHISPTLSFINRCAISPPHSIIRHSFLLEFSSSYYLLPSIHFHIFFQSIICMLSHSLLLPYVSSCWSSLPLIPYRIFYAFPLYNNLPSVLSLLPYLHLSSILFLFHPILYTPLSYPPPIVLLVLYSRAS